MFLKKVFGRLDEENPVSHGEVFDYSIIPPLFYNTSLMLISVIIPVTRPQKALRVMRIIKEQSCSGGRVEIILVKDKGDLSPGKRRNLGAKRAKGEALIFLDDDCLPGRNWLANNLAVLEDKTIGAVGGMVSGKSGAYFARCHDFSNFTFAQATRRREMPVCSASLAIRKDVFSRAGGFNEEMFVGEDTDLCFRLKGLGYRVVYEPKIKIFHDHGRKDVLTLWRYQYRNGRLKGLTIENRYPAGFWFAFLKDVSRPEIYWPLVLPLAFLATLVTLAVNFKDQPKVIFYAPGIFLGKLACQLGIFVWTLKNPLVNLAVLNLFVTSLCQSKCRHCFFADNLNKKDDLSIEKIEELSRSLGRVGTLNLSGGEPFLQKDIVRICRHFFDHNKTRTVSIPTNGLMGKTIVKKTAEMLAISEKLRVVVCFSLDGTQVEHDRIRGVVGNFEKLLKAYESLAKMKKESPNLSLRVGTVVYKENYSDLFELYKLIPRLFPKIDAVTFSLGRPSKFGDKLELPTMAQLKKLFLFKQKTADKDRPWWRLVLERMIFIGGMEAVERHRQTVPCQAGRGQMVVFANGQVGLCEMHEPIGNLKRSALAAILGSEKAIQLKRTIRENRCYCSHEGFFFYSLRADVLAWPELLVKSLILK